MGRFFRDPVADHVQDEEDPEADHERVEERRRLVVGQVRVLERTVVQREEEDDAHVRRHGGEGASLPKAAVEHVERDADPDERHEAEVAPDPEAHPEGHVGRPARSG
jgi:hypothetical protein